jgi:Ca2+-binding RTX toxin-like protein
MTTYIPATNVTQAATVFPLATDDRVYIGEGIQVASTDPGAASIDATGGVNNQITIDGTVGGNFAVRLSAISALTIGLTGRISAFDIAVFVSGSGNLVDNDGTIYGGAVGFYCDLGLGALHNSGAIIAGYGTFAGVNAAIYDHNAFPNFPALIENSGLIQARKAGSFAFFGDQSNAVSDTIVNTGRIIGVVQLGGGNDSYSGAAGHLAGHLLGGTGNDTATGGTDNDWFDGGADNDTLTGNAGNDTLTGGAGTDVLNGGLGNDVYVLENGTDTVIDTGGIDTITSTISRSLAGYATVENLALINLATALNGTGNNFNNTLAGNNFGNILSGGLGNDVLAAGIGNDRLFGGPGNDSLSGGLNSDIFVFNTAPNATANRDAITDFSHVDDTIQLENAVFAKLTAAGPLNPAFFRFGAAALDANDYIVYNQATGGLFYDVNGNGAGGAILFAVLNNKQPLLANDFAVI